MKLIPYAVLEYLAIHVGFRHGESKVNIDKALWLVALGHMGSFPAKIKAHVDVYKVIWLVGNNGLEKMKSNESVTPYTIIDQ